jgi:hypothetical protein
VLVLGGHRVAAAPDTATTPWRQLEPGLELARFSTADTLAHPEGDLFVLRADPARWELRLLSAATLGDRRGRSAREWCREHGLVAAINAGMYQADGRSHVGFVSCGGEVIQEAANTYRSAAAFGCTAGDGPPFRIVDLDAASLDSLVLAYECVVQNLRLIKRPREPRWYRRDRAWREAALGEDGAGRPLLIYCRTPLTMPDFIALLLALPLDLQAAQHLEGGAEAQLHVHHPSAARDFDEGRWLAWPVPNVLGLVRK